MRQISLRFIAVLSLLLLSLVPAAGQDSASEAAKLFPKTVSDFRLQGSPRPLLSPSPDAAPAEDDGVRERAEGLYVSPKGESLTVRVAVTRSQAVAYSFLSREAARMRGATPAQVTKLSDVGVAGVADSGNVVFYKGHVFVTVTDHRKRAGEDGGGLITLARDYAGTLPEAEKEIPFLVKHLPEWEAAQDRAVYAVSLPVLQNAAGQQPVFDVINFDGSAEAVTAPYDASRLVIVEYATPQLAADADARIAARLGELRAQGQSTPSAYRKVGNYAVFVFGAPDEAAAARLIDGVKWEQKIQWLGENPLLWARAEKQHTRQAVSLILGIAKTIGIFVGICLGVGAVFGGAFYLSRKMKQRAASESYSDAGGMLRLNIDEMTAETDPSKLLTAGDEKSVAR
ncbi:MAG TPA: DUF6599 family protein [Pyrinomonadaceae bacterium]|nr:DUF6599 family protein [Pyrinomonadaceae bacterium]